MAARNSFSQYFLLRNGAAAPVSSLDGMQMLGLDVMNQQQATISRWNAEQSMVMTSRDTLMEALPSQQIRFQKPSKQFNDSHIELKQQSKIGFKTFSIRK